MGGKTWLERQLSSFTGGTEFETTQKLKALAMRARESSGNAEELYWQWVAEIAPDPSIEPDFGDWAHEAWECAQDLMPWQPLELRAAPYQHSGKNSGYPSGQDSGTHNGYSSGTHSGYSSGTHSGYRSGQDNGQDNGDHSSLHMSSPRETTASSSQVSPLTGIEEISSPTDTTIRSSRQTITPLGEDLCVMPRVKRVYDALVAHAEHCGISKHAVGIDLFRLAEAMHYRRDASRALKDVNAAVSAGVLAVLVKGRKSITSSVYCLRGRGETLVEAIEDGKQQRAYSTAVSAGGKNVETSRPAVGLTNPKPVGKPAVCTEEWWALYRSEECWRLTDALWASHRSWMENLKKTQPKTFKGLIKRYDF